MGRIASLSEAGVGLMGFSLAGATRSTHNAIQVHSDLVVELWQYLRSALRTHLERGRMRRFQKALCTAQAGF